MDRWLIEGIGWRWIGSTLTVACCLAAPAAAAGSGKADLTVTKVRGVPAHALTGDKLSLKVTVANKGNARSKPATVSSRLAPEAGTPLPDLIGKAKVGRLAAKHATTEKMKTELHPSAVGAL